MEASPSEEPALGILWVQSAWPMKSPEFPDHLKRPSVQDSIGIEFPRSEAGEWSKLAVIELTKMLRDLTKSWQDLKFLYEISWDYGNCYFPEFSEITKAKIGKWECGKSEEKNARPCPEC